MTDKVRTDVRRPSAELIEELYWLRRVVAVAEEWDWNHSAWCRPGPDEPPEPEGPCICGTADMEKALDDYREWFPEGYATDRYTI